MSKVAIYLRVSTAEQGLSGLGLEAQEAACRAALSPDDIIIGVFTDIGVSGSVAPEKRPGAAAALRAVSTHQADAVIVSKLDRLSRSTIHAVQLAGWFKAHKNFRALDLGVDLSTPGGRMMLTMMAAVAEFELELMAARQRDAHAARRARGIAGARGTVKRERPDLVDRIISDRAIGMTWQAIADRLNDEQIPTMRGGTHWRVSSVQSAGGYKRKGKMERETKPSVMPSVDRVARKDGASIVTKRKAAA